MISPKPGKTAALEPGKPAAPDPLLAEDLPQIVWRARADGRIDYLNRFAREFFGARALQAVRRHWELLAHVDDLPYVRERWRAALRDGANYEQQLRLRRADGTYRWHLATASPRRGSRGEILSWIGGCTDIEELVLAAQEMARKLREHPAAEDAQRLRSIMMLWSDFYWETDREHRFTVLESGGRFDQTRFVSTRIGKTRWETPSVLPDAEGWERHREVLAARVPFRDFETARRSEDGMLHYYSIDGEPMVDASGGFLGYRGVGREITARKLAEQALRESGERFRALLDSVPGVAWIKDSGMRFVWVSASYERLLGKPLEAIRGRSAFELWPAAAAERFQRANEKVLRINGAIRDVFDTNLPDGSIVRWLAVRFPLPDETGAPGVAGIAFDISEPGADAPEPNDDTPLAQLSGRELQVLHLMVEGCTSAEMAAQLKISPKSVDTYRSRLMSKLGLEDLPALVKFALRHGLTGKH